MQMPNNPYYSYKPQRQQQRAVPPRQPTPSPRTKQYHFKQWIVLVASVFILGVTWFALAHASPLTHSVEQETQSIAKKITSKPAPAVIIPPIVSKLHSAWQGALASGTPGDVAIAVYDHKTNQTISYATSQTKFNTASIIKLSILEEMLIQNQTAGTTPSDEQMSQATPMIENSDNTAASALWQSLGGANTMNGFFQKVGAKSTIAGTDGDWGLTQTTATDQLKVLNALAYPGEILTTSSAQIANSLLDNVENDQTWGVSAGLPSGVSVELKNGWLADAETNDSYASTNDWVVNSIGHVHGEGQDYTIAVLSQGNPSEQSGITRIESLATLTWNTISAN